jgi:hypothetical protein
VGVAHAAYRVPAVRPCGVLRVGHDIGGDEIMTDERRGIPALFAEMSREGGLLYGVFGFLEGQLYNKPASWFWTIGMISIVVVVVGVVAERLRPPSGER